jgi:hypothetical protein
MIDLEKMAKEHEKLFPKADLASQVIKLEEELNEVGEAKDEDHVIRELADCVICCAGMYRFAPKTAELLDGAIGTASRKYVDEEVERKWRINLKRTWEWNGKTYKHKGKDGNE